MPDPSESADVVRSLFADDPDMVELVELFVAELPEKIGAMEQMYEENSREELGRIAHQLKGASGGYGFDAIGHSASRLEQAIKTNAASDDVRRAMQELIDLCGRASI